MNIVKYQVQLRVREASREGEGSKDSKIRDYVKEKKVGKYRVGRQAGWGYFIASY